jgi:DNA-binding protein YbaB
MSTVDFESWEAELAGARLSGTGPEGLARAAVDGTGRLVDLRLDPSLMRRSVGAAAKEILAAVAKAQEAARAAGSKHAADLEAIVSQASADAEAYRHEAERRMDELNTLVSRLVSGREQTR